uniref:Uncharacterized protein n=1 Tax=Eucampia antarctica TaxID=49252 RepID=A0A7S2S627_9STRA|mmetsp:Transcript_3525/g.3342  ORF Transcript_3525/g.3342 Transcript_3525/m.3342 type:complete len:103 (+) Transcript_3525:123-431(+)
MLSRTNADKNASLKRSSVKLQSQKVNNLDGDDIKWHPWKKKTRAAIGTAELLRIIDERTHADRNEDDNETVFHLLQVSTSEGNASHLIDKYESDRDGHVALH